MKPKTSRKGRRNTRTTSVSSENARSAAASRRGEATTASGRRRTMTTSGEASRLAVSAAASKRGGTTTASGRRRTSAISGGASNLAMGPTAHASGTAVSENTMSAATLRRRGPSKASGRKSAVTALEGASGLATGPAASTSGNAGNESDDEQPPPLQRRPSYNTSDDEDAFPLAVSESRRTGAQPAAGIGWEPDSFSDWTESDSEGEGNRRIDDYFKIDMMASAKKQRGRRASRRARAMRKQGVSLIPRKRSKSAKAAAKKASVEEVDGRAHVATSDKAKDPSPKQPPKKRKPTDWSKDPRLAKAVREWDAGPPTEPSSKKGKPMSLNAFAKMKQIPPSTFKKYACADKSKRKPIGTKMGRAAVLKPEQSEFLCQMAIRKDRANEGYTPAELATKIQQLNSSLSLQQAQNHMRTFRKRHAGRIKPRAVKAQKTTSRRSQFTVAQQYRWRITVDKAMNMLRRKNQGRCKETGLTFGELIEHFIVGGDETNLIADASGDMKIVGEFGRQKHEKMAGDCRASCTMYRTGTSGGNNGPTIFLMAGKKVKHGFTGAFLNDNGAATGSQIVMTENAYMTEEAWEKMTPGLVKGIRDLPFVKNNPQWYVVEIFDGFGAHLNNEVALRLRTENRIISIKEEGDSSSINQAYDRLVAKSDKTVQRNNLSYLRQLKGSNEFRDQWDLIHVGLAAVRYTREHPKLWINSFKLVNLHPRHMLPFDKWCEEIAPFMQAADSFDLVTQNNVDKYQLLPAPWQAMPPSDKQNAVNIYNKYDNGWSPQCLKELMDSLSVGFDDIRGIQVGIWLAIEDPTHLNRGLEDVELNGEESSEKVVSPATPSEKIGEVDSSEKDTSTDASNKVIANVEASRKTATHDLSVFLLKPPGMKGKTLFNHMIAMRQRKWAKDPMKHRIDSAVNIDTPTKKHQKRFFDIDPIRVAEANIMDDVGHGVNLRQAARAKLDYLGQVKSHSCFVNDPSRYQRLKERAELAQSIGQIQAAQETEKQKKAAQEKSALLALLPEAVLMFRANEMNKRSFLKDHARAILMIAFKHDGKGKKGDLIEQLTLLEAQDTEGRIDRALRDTAEDYARVSLPPLPQLQTNELTSPALSNTLQSESLQSESTHASTSVATTTVPTALVAAAAPQALHYWLYHRCCAARNTMESPLSGLQISLLVLRKIKQIKQETCGYSSDDEFDYAKSFLTAFDVESGNAKKRDMIFVMDLVGKVDEMIKCVDDGSLTEEVLRQHSPLD